MKVLPCATHWIRQLAGMFTACLVLSVASAADTQLVRVLHVTDGDTLLVVGPGGRKESVRIAAIDAPEKQRKDVPGQRFAQRSRAHLATLLNGQRVRLVSEGRDDYQRIVARVWLEDTDIGLAQVCAGYAWVFERYITAFVEADQQAYRACQARAKGERAGLWQDSAPVPPWIWRHTHRQKPERR